MPEMTKKSVIIVDDSYSTARQLKRILDQSGEFEVIYHADNGAEGLRAYKEKRPDIVIMDVIMPVLDGLKAMKMLLEMDPQANVVMLSSIGGVGDKVVNALKLGAKSVIPKPFEPEKVLDILRSL